MERSAPPLSETGAAEKPQEQAERSAPAVALAVPPAEPSYPSQTTLARWLLVVLALLGIGWLLWSAWATLSPFLFGLVLAYLMLPFVNFLNRYTSRPMAIFTVYFAGILLIVTSFAYLIPLLAEQIARLITSIPSVERLQEIGTSLILWYRDRVPENLQPSIDEAANNALQSVQANIAGYAQSAGTFLLNRVLALLNTLTFILGFLALPIWLFYVLNDEAKGKQEVDRLLHPRARADFWNVFTILDNVLGNYVRGQLILCVAVGVAVGLGLTVLQLVGFEIGDFILVLAIIAGVTEFVPVLGPIIGSIPGILLGLAVSPGTGLAVGLLYFAVQQLENSLLVPRIIGESVSIHPAVLTVILIAMGYLFGLIGIILAPPAAATARDLFVYLYRRLEGFTASQAFEVVSAIHHRAEQQQG